MPLQLIDDGYTRNETVETPGWPDVAIQYRPALPKRAEDYAIASNKAKDGAAIIKAAADLITECVSGWDIEAKAGQPAAVNPFAVERLPPPVRNRIIDRITSYTHEQAAGDEKNSVTG